MVPSIEKVRRTPNDNFWGCTHRRSPTLAVGPDPLVEPLLAWFTRLTVPAPPARQPVSAA